MLDRDGRFLGFLAPQYTQVPDELFDELLATLSGPETKVLLYLIRRTFGFKRHSDAISLNQMLHGLKSRDGRQLDRGVGLSKPTIVKALKGLEEKNVIITRRERLPDGGYGPNTYALNVIRGSQSNLLPSESQFTTPQQGTLQPLVKPLNLQETDSDITGEHTEVQHQPPTDAVVASLLCSPNDLLTALQELGLKPSVARRLIREYSHQHIARMVEFAIYKVRMGWRPKESLPAWLVSAIRGNYQTPEYFQTAAERHRQVKDRAEQRRREQEAEELRMQEQRAELLSRLGVNQEIQAYWERAQELLRNKGEWTISLVGAHLVERGDRMAIVVPFEFAQRRIEAMREKIEEAIAQVVGRPVCVEVVCDREALGEAL